MVKNSGEDFLKDPDHQLNHFTKSYDQTGKADEIDKNISDTEINMKNKINLNKRKINTETNSNNMIGINNKEIRHKINSRPKTSYNFRMRKTPNKSQAVEDGNKSCNESDSKIGENSNNSKSPIQQILDLDLQNKQTPVLKGSANKNIRGSNPNEENIKDKKNRVKILPLSIYKVKNEQKKVLEALLERPRSKTGGSKFHKDLKNLGMIYLQNKGSSKSNSNSKEKGKIFHLNNSFQ